MEKRELVLNEITKIFRMEFNDPTLEITYGSSTHTIDKWDSINNLILLTAIEERFALIFHIDIILKAKNVGDLCDFIVSNSHKI